MTPDDPVVVAHGAYATETRLLDRRSIHETSEGPGPLDIDRITDNSSA